MLQDAHGRQITYLRLAVTDRCNLRCRYCMPAEGIDFSPQSELLTFEEILQVTRVLSEMGVRKVRLTGGEPLVRRDLLHLVSELGTHIPELAMTTNALLLTPQNLKALRSAGLNHYNVSLDTLREDRFEQITRRKGFVATLERIEMLLAAGAKTRLNTVVMGGTNDDELLDFVALTEDKDLDVRFIEAMPFNEGDGNRQLFVSYDEMLKRIRTAHPDLERADQDKNSSANRFRVPGYRGGIGIIPAYSRSLCGSCNRLRMTSKGTLMNCLYSTKGLELRPLLRQGISNEGLGALIRQFVLGKYADGHETERHEQQGTVFQSMTSIGG